MRRIAIVVLALALMLPATALAQGSSTCQAYNPQGCAVNSVGGTTTSTPNQTVSASTSTLPFTGLDAALLVAGGICLLGVGLVLRRVVGRAE